ncbi:MAG: 50S ribosomal protein L9 [Anaerolineae bacterium]|nr:50S ribosomal protein L9 [Anaerolineae bacterium]
MKVFLKKDVSGVGKANEVVSVAEGYARNYLLPRGLGVRANAGEIKAAQQYAASQALRAKRARERAEDLAKLLVDKELHFTVKAGATGRLYGSITSANITDQLERELGIEIDHRWLALDRPIREIGEHIVTLKLEGGVRGQVKVVVESVEA